jgi:hypothetical protein
MQSASAQWPLPVPICASGNSLFAYGATAWQAGGGWSAPPEGAIKKLRKTKTQFRHRRACINTFSDNGLRWCPQGAAFQKGE